jgi:hypothetical protein
MRSQGQIRHQLKQVIYRHLQKRLRANFKKRPDTCCYNREVELDDTSSVFLCGVTSAAGNPRNVPCDARIPGCLDMARDCPLWEPIKSKAEVKAEFHEIIQSGDRGIIASEFPDIAALLWVLDDPDDVPTRAEVEAAVEAAAGEEPEPHRTWWDRLLKKLGGGS